MLNIDRVLERCVKKKFLTADEASVARVMAFEKVFILPAGGTFAAPSVLPAQQQNFASGAILVGIDFDSQPDGQPVNPYLTGRERFEITFSYPTGDRLINVTGLASAIRGRNGENQYPSKEVYLPPQQNIQIDTQTRLPEQLLVTVHFDALIWKFAS
jgi:hypothetical protein